MSYNTRRTGGVGRGAPTTQVNYHQQPARTVGSAVQSRNPGYSTTNSQTNYTNSSQPTHTTQASYTTAPPLPPQSPKSQPAVQAAAQQPPLPVHPSSQQPPENTPTTPKSIVKQEPPATPVDTPKTETSENGDGPKPFWKKKAYVKVSNKIRKARQNAKLRRVLNPKNALTFLNELRPGSVKFVVREEPGWGFVASVDIDGKTYSGHALTVSKAKVQASEQALRSVLLDQLSRVQAASSPTDSKKDGEEKEENEDESMDTNETSTSDESVEPKSKKIKSEQPEDDLPWSSLAAFALHKLFAEWQKDGSEAHPPAHEKYEEEIGEDAYFPRRPGPPPEFGYPRRFAPGGPFRGRGYAPYPPRGGPPPPGFGPMARRLPPPPAATFLAQGASKPALPLAATAMPMKKIPEDANKRHPVMILNQLKPSVIYNESREGAPPNIVFIITVQIDGKEYIGRGKSKKDAKKNAAKAALAPIGIVYDEEN